MPVAPRLRLLLLAMMCAAVLAAAMAFVSVWSGVRAESGHRTAAMATAGEHFTSSSIALSLLLAGLAGLAGASIASHRAKDHLRQARADRQALIGLLDVWHWQTDREHRITQWLAPAGAATEARPPADARPLALGERFPSDPADQLPERMHSHASIADLPLSLRSGGGEARNWLLRGAPRFDAEGRFDGYIGTARPNEQRRTPSAPPQAAVPSAAVTDKPSQEAEDAAAFSYTVSHDLRAPLRVVEGFTRILKEDYARSLDRIGIDHLDRVLGAAARMSSMIDALLALSQLSQQPLARQPVNLSQLAGYVVDDLRRGAPERAVEMRIDSDLAAEGDPTLLRVALENLLGNAWKYTQHTNEARVCFEATQRGARTIYVVRDNGAGFDMRFAERLFGVFQRLHSATDFPGTGIGLASVRRIVRRHGGQIWAESEPGRGASFYFTLAEG